MNIVSLAKTFIERHEGRLLHVYKDSLGIPTVGVGFNLNDPYIRELCMKGKIDWQALIDGTLLTDEACDWLYTQIALNVVQWLSELFPDYDSYTINRKVALLDMGYNMGEPRFLGFQQMIGAIHRGEWNEAAKQALSSKWAEQVGVRATTDARMLALG